MHLAALEAYLKANKPGLLDAFEDWYDDVTRRALDAYAFSGFEDGEAILRDAVRSPRRYDRRSARRVRAHSILVWYQTLLVVARRIYAARLPRTEQRARLLELVEEVRERFCPIGPGAITLESLPEAATAEGFAKASLRFFLPPRASSGKATRDRRSIGTTLKLARKHQLPPLDPALVVSIARLDGPRDQRALALGLLAEHGYVPG